MPYMPAALLLCGDETITRTVTRVFKDLGVEVEVFDDQKAAARKLGAKKFDAIVADDEVSGATMLLEAARGLPMCGKSVRIILAGGPTAIGTAFQNGTQIVLYKPLSPERVRHGLRAVRNLMAQERRGGFKRVRVDFEAKVSYGKFANKPVAVEDLSDSGAAIRSENPLPASARLSFECTLPGSHELLKAKAEIVWQDTSGGVGIRFLDMPARSRKRLVEWLASESNLESVPDLESGASRTAAKAGV
ncbi:MAG: PilZ domain-containing protein [Terriglobales bacterium]|jgi:CheY-like chemotaxis protein